MPDNVCVWWWWWWGIESNKRPTTCKAVQVDNKNYKVFAKSREQLCKTLKVLSRGANFQKVSDPLARQADLLLL